MSIKNFDGTRDFAAKPLFEDVEIVEGRLQFRLSVDLGFHVQTYTIFALLDVRFEPDKIDGIKTYLASWRDKRTRPYDLRIHSHQIVGDPNALPRIWWAKVARLDAGQYHDLAQALRAQGFCR